MKSKTDTNTWLTIAEAAEYCRVSESWLRSQISKGRLKFTRSNGDTGKIMFKSLWLDELFMQGVQNG